VVHLLCSHHILSGMAQAHLDEFALNAAVHSAHAECLAHVAINSLPHLTPRALLLHFRVSGTNDAATAGATETGVGGTAGIVTGASDVPCFGKGFKPKAFKAHPAHACTTCPVGETPVNIARL